MPDLDKNLILFVNKIEHAVYVINIIANIIEAEFMM